MARSAVRDVSQLWSTAPVATLCVDVVLVKVRRVEEQKEMLTLLAKEAKTVYDCAVSVFPSNAANMTER